jgi:sugar/nucleoside kinase (ribokinase family)
MKPGGILLLKEGEHGSTVHMLSDGDLLSLHTPALNAAKLGLAVIDTTGAGDAYTGAFAVKMA